MTTPTSQPPQLQWCGAPLVVPFQHSGPCPKIHVPLLGDIQTHALTADELAHPPAPNTGLPGIGGAGEATTPNSATGFGLGDLIDATTHLVNDLLSGTFWKSTGLVVVAILVGGLGAYLWLGSGQGERVERSAEKAAVL